MTNKLTVADRAAIDSLFSRYAWALDTGDDETFVSLFTNDARIADPSGNYAGDGAPARFIEAMRANTTFPGRQHWVGQLILEGDTNSCRARSFALVTSRLSTGATNVHLIAAYFDQLIKSDGNWYFAERIVEPWRDKHVREFPEVLQRPAWARKD